MFARALAAKLNRLSAALRRLLFAAVFQLPIAQAAPDASCYPPDIPAPPLGAQTLVVVDRTTWPEPVAKRDFIDAVQTLVGQGSQRLVILSFAGIAAGESLARELDLRLEAPLRDPETINNSRIGPFKRSQACVAQRQRQALDASRQTLERLLVPPAAGLARSEIAWALARTLREFTGSGDHGGGAAGTAGNPPTRLLIFSDGLQHGSGQSFYQPHRANEPPRPRRIDAHGELRKLAAGVSSPPATGQPAARLWWWGLLAAEARDGPPRYADADLLARYENYWRAAVRQWQGELVAIGPTINNPRFDAGSTVSSAANPPPLRPSSPAQATRHDHP